LDTKRHAAPPAFIVVHRPTVETVGYGFWAMVSFCKSAITPPSESESKPKRGERFFAPTISKLTIGTFQWFDGGCVITQTGRKFFRPYDFQIDHWYIPMVRWWLCHHPNEAKIFSPLPFPN
jgi:hypothetical protein